ncbi:hypothetical protein LOKO_03259 [Halomonas chromatireducens]|uniref:Uncharacterized protein n=2 Tax=Halomonas chromatireducens TaxID=507626 RepID=A0A0X8HGS9_9GAMM|nr:hypothetical protein LOKO_03259 [Halomonas chromatireducens]
MKDLMDGAPSTLHGTGALAAQMEFLTTHKVSDFTAVIDPLLSTMQDDSASADFKDTVSQVLNSSSPRMADLYGEAYLAHLMDLVWRSRDEEDAEGPGMMLWHVMRLAEHATVVVRLVAEDFDDHVTDWSMHPASALAIESGMTRGLERTITRELASVVMGKAIASPVLDMDYLGPHLSRGGTPLFDLQQNTVAGVIALYEPTVFAGDKPESYPFPVAPYTQPMLAQPGRFASEPDEKAEWLAFLERVAALGDPDFSPVAETALASF